MAKKHNTLSAVPAHVTLELDALKASDLQPIVIYDANMAAKVVSLLQQFYMGENEGDPPPDSAVTGMYFLLGAVRDVLEREEGVARG